MSPDGNRVRVCAARPMRGASLLIDVARLLRWARRLLRSIVWSLSSPKFHAYPTPWSLRSPKFHAQPIDLPRTPTHSCYMAYRSVPHGLWICLPVPIDVPRTGYRSVAPWGRKAYTGASEDARVGMGLAEVCGTRRGMSTSRGLQAMGRANRRERGGLGTHTRSRCNCSSIVT